MYKKLNQFMIKNFLRAIFGKKKETEVITQDVITVNETMIDEASFAFSESTGIIPKPLALVESHAEDTQITEAAAASKEKLKRSSRKPKDSVTSFAENLSEVKPKRGRKPKSKSAVEITTNAELTEKPKRAKRNLDNN
jgi:hypothetical protein